MSSSDTTIDHDRIREWAESRGGRPSIVHTQGGKGKNRSGGVLRLDFREKDENLDETSWEEFFEVFEESNLAFLFQDRTADGKESRFNKFIERPADMKASRGRKAASGKGASGRSAGSSSKATSGKDGGERKAGGSGTSRARGGRKVTKAELMEKARAKNIPGRSRMNKAELEKAVA